MNKIKLIHNVDEFLLEINEKKIEMVEEYNIISKAKDKGICELNIKIPIDINNSSIDIKN